MTQVALERVTVRGAHQPDTDRVLTAPALAFLRDLHDRFEETRRSLLARREERQDRIRTGELPRFLDETRAVRSESWQVVETPPDLRKRVVEITGPVDRKMMINALNSGADVFMADFEDALSPTWSNVVTGQGNCQDAVRRTISFRSPEGKQYALNDRIATLMVRPRGWHLPEKHLEVDGSPISASLFDFGLYFFHNARALLERGSGPYFYLPKLENHLEARLWNDVFEFAQDALGVPRGSVRATVLIENVLAAFEMDEILYELRHHIAGLNAGRWDYILSVMLVRRINNALVRADQVEWSENGGSTTREWLAPIVADAEAGFGGPLHAYELARAYIEAGASGIHLEDQLAAEKKCGHMGGKVLVPTSQFERVLSAARLASDVLDVPTVIFARTDAEAATLLTSDIDERDRNFLTGERTPEGYYRVRPGLESAIARALAYAAYADVVWCETKTPDLEEARRFAEAVHAEYPDKLLAYNCSPSFNWKRNLGDTEIAKFQTELGAMGYRYQFITLAGWHLVNLGAFELGREYEADEMSAYVRLQEREFHLEEKGYTAVRHQREVGANYFDLVLATLSHGGASTGAMAGSTEAEQFVQPGEPAAEVGAAEGGA